MHTSYLFDVDGTLTPPRQRMTDNFIWEFISWSNDRSVFLVTGSDMKKLSEQLPSSVVQRMAGIFTSMGNQLTINGTLVYNNDWEPPTELLKALVSWRMNSPYTNKRDNFIEHRVGMVNFSVAGRDSNFEERKSYYDWDRFHKERKSIAKEIQIRFPKIEAKLGGQISIDIQPKGNNKALASQWVRDNIGDRIVFVGDRCEEGGNDYDIVQDIIKHGDGEYYPVKNFLETFQLLPTI